MELKCVGDSVGYPMLDEFPTRHLRRDSLSMVSAFGVFMDLSEITTLDL